jgi:hypothetical protein
MSDNQKLIPVIVTYSEPDSVWTLAPQSQLFPKLSFKADSESLRRFLRRVRAKDSLTFPKSRKGTTYQIMIEDISQKGSSTIYIWKSRCPTSIELVRAIMEI